MGSQTCRCQKYVFYFLFPSLSCIVICLFPSLSLCPAHILILLLSPVNVNQFSHVSFDESTLYVNDQVVSLPAVSFSSERLSRPPLLFSLGHNFTGSIDEVVVYDRRSSATPIPRPDLCSPRMYLFLPRKKSEDECQR